MYRIEGKPACVISCATSSNLSVLRGICHGDEDDLKEMLGDFIEINGSVISDLETAINANVSDDISGHAHKLKGSAGTAGAKALAEIAKKLEKMGSSGDKEMLAALAIDLRAEFDRVCSDIKKLRD
mgnify:CR=1 FL=1